MSVLVWGYYDGRGFVRRGRCARAADPNRLPRLALAMVRFFYFTARVVHEIYVLQSRRCSGIQEISWEYFFQLLLSSKFVNQIQRKNA